MEITKQKESKAMKESQKSTTASEVRPTRALTPFEEMDRMFERWFEHAFPRGWLRPFRAELPTLNEIPMPLEARLPNVDVIDRDDELLVRAELPGIEKDNLDVSISENSVTIKGESKHESKEEKGDFYRCEISQGSFARTVSLPHTINTEKSAASFKNGVLELTLPKIEKAKRRTIKID